MTIGGTFGDSASGSRSEMVDTQMAEAIEAARKSRSEGGIPIGAALVLDGRVIATGYNQRVQLGSAIRHGEMDAFENAGRLTASAYTRMTMVTTLAPCDMCTGAILLYRIPHVVVGEDRTFKGSLDLLRERGVAVTVLDDPACIAMMSEFIAAEPALWSEDIGV